MKKRSRKLISFLMVFALLGGLLCGVYTVKAQEPLSMERAYARQVNTSKKLSYGNSVADVVTLNCTLYFTHGLPSGQPNVSPQSYSTSINKPGYAIAVTNVNVSNGNPTTVRYDYIIYQNGANGTPGSAFIYFYNSGTYSWN